MLTIASTTASCQLREISTTDLQALFTHGTAIPLPRESVPLLRSRQDSSPRRPSPRRQPAVRPATPARSGSLFLSVTLVRTLPRAASRVVCGGTVKPVHWHLSSLEVLQTGGTG